MDGGGGGGVLLQRVRGDVQHNKEGADVRGGSEGGGGGEGGDVLRGAGGPAGGGGVRGGVHVHGGGAGDGVCLPRACEGEGEEVAACGDVRGLDGVVLGGEGGDFLEPLENWLPHSCLLAFLFLDFLNIALTFLFIIGPASYWAYI